MCVCCCIWDGESNPRTDTECADRFDYGVIDIFDNEIKYEVDLEESNDEVDSEEWSDDPKHGNLNETDWRLREQE